MEAVVKKKKKVLNKAVALAYSDDHKYAKPLLLYQGENINQVERFIPTVLNFIYMEIIKTR